MSGPKRLMDLEGAWSLSRLIRDARSGHDSTFEGRAVFTPSDTGLHYAETGTLRMPGAAPMQAERRYNWSEAGGLIHVAFDDGRPFHSFDLSAPEPTAHHDCPPDDYNVAYDFSAWPNWRAIWEVRGPRKDYRMESRYTRD